MADTLTPLPCPFCGDAAEKGRQEVTQMNAERNKFVRIICRVCGAMCPEENWDARAVLAAAVPAGHKVVPLEPTPEMLKAADRAYTDLPLRVSDDREYAATYRAMIQAAPERTP